MNRVLVVDAALLVCISKRGVADGSWENKKYACVHVYLFLFSIVSDRYRCLRAVALFSDGIDACVFGLYAQRSLSLHSGVGAATCISDVYRCFHSKVARTAIAIAAIGRLRLSAMAIAACMVILRATCCLEFFGPRTRNMCLLTTGGCFLVVLWRMVQRSRQRF
jgi:succinate dehydrogenase hydrophobic anchor subunit